MPDTAGWEQWEGRTVAGNDGKQIGRIAQVYLDHESGQPTWGSVYTGLVGAGQALIPLRSGRWHGDTFQVPYSSEVCRTAPHFAEDQELTHADQRRLHEHYGIGENGGASGAGSPPVIESPAATPGVEVTRSEERVRVGVARTAGGSVRLRKTVVTEPISRTVTVRHEEVRIIREPITEPDFALPENGVQLHEEVHEVMLMEEEPVLEKTVVPVERVQLNTTVTEEQRQVRGEVRREQIQIDRQPHA